MQSALDLALNEAKAAGAQRLFTITLRVGALSGTVPDALQFAFVALVPGTPAERARLVIDNVPACFWCEQCQRDFESESLLAECPACGRISHATRSGRELEIASLEIE